MPNWKDYLNSINKPRTYLLLANFLLVLFLILLGNLKILPLLLGDFIFFALLVLAFAVYRPGWAFLLFIGTLPLENISLAPEIFPITVRPYQLLAAAIMIAVIVRLLTKRLPFKLAKPKWFDWLIVLIFIASLASVLTSPHKSISFNLTIILASFVAIYFLVRTYIQDLVDLKKIIPFFLSSGMVVSGYAIWQNARFSNGLFHFEVMPGRPNATFSEPDWLGVYLVLLLSVIYGIIHHSVLNSSNRHSVIQHQDKKIYRYSLCYCLLLVLVHIALILTVSRSAWLGAAVVTFIFHFIFLTELRYNPKVWRWKKTIGTMITTAAIIIFSLGSVYLFHLTNFQLSKRMESSKTGMQEITISCEQNTKLLTSAGNSTSITNALAIKNVDELAAYQCRHIDLEEIEKEKQEGKIITTAVRPDPNVEIRSNIYSRTLGEIRKHWFFGIGWGNIGQILGTDERGTTLNASNIFLEIWLGAGIIGLFPFGVFLGNIFIRAIRIYFYSEDHSKKTIGLFLLVSFFAVILPNLFNAGIFLGFFWVWLGVTMVKLRVE